MNGKVSLITPCYNGERFLQLYIDNIMRQEYADIEVIFVDDGSTNDISFMEDRIREAVKKKGYEFVFLQKENGGAASAVHLALQYATGEYLMLLDMDDEIFERAVSAKAEYLQLHPETDIVISNGYYVFEDKRRHTRPFLRKKPANANCIFEGLLKTTFYNWPGSYMVRSKSFFEVNKGRDIFQSPYGQNMQILLPATIRRNICFLNEFHMNYYVRKSSVSHTSDNGKMQQLLYGYEHIRETVIQKICEDMREKERYLHMIWVAGAKKQLRFSCRNKDKTGMEESYERLKSLGEVGFRDSVVYFCRKSVALMWFYKGTSHVIERVTNRVI
ncbi:MAG: glycosyltransferase family 2 protein [Lachnospiraceae bacterium]|nr:glycosyltransferase family 2 protein [Lachnospiraceae bacterium]